MNKPEGWDNFVSSITTDRPWQANETTERMLSIIGQTDIARVIYSLFGSGSVSFITQNNRDLGNSTPLDLLKTEHGILELRLFLMSNPWLL